ncbi:hypothetical protein V6N13_053868 [Hibiscus sabdariffa]
MAINLPPDANLLLPSSALENIQRPQQTGADLGTLVKSATPQVITGSDKSCLATFVYAIPDYRKRRALWDYLRDLSLHIQEPWVVLGDFNATLCSMDRRGCANSARPDPDFHNAVIDCGLHDLGSNGPSFTWFKGQCVVRLDRALSNALWLSSFPTASLLHLLRMKSDHHPIML